MNCPHKWPKKKIEKYRLGVTRIGASGTAWECLDSLVGREDVSTLACNRIDLLFGNTHWRPDYYFCFTSLLKDGNSDWVNSVKAVAENADTICFLHQGASGKVNHTNNTYFADNLFEHNRHRPIPDDLFDRNFDDVQLKSFSATVPLFQFCFSNNVKTIGIIGQDGYIFDQNNNHFDSKYGSESSNFKKTNHRIISLHHIIRKYAEKNGIRVYNLTKKSIIKVHPYISLEEFLNL